MGGSCWAFSTTGALEGAWQIATGRLRALSEQQLIDCSTANNACGGGSMDVAFRYLRDNEVCTEESYAYEARSGMCRQADTGICAIGIPRGAVLGYRDVAMNDEKSLIAAVAQGPVSVGVDADTTFQLYSGGVLDKTCGTNLNHGVLVVGYGTEGGVDFWKVKNSWGPRWGLGGFILIKRGLSGSGQCGINSMASYPVVDGSLSVPTKSLPSLGPSTRVVSSKWAPRESVMI